MRRRARARVRMGRRTGRTSDAERPTDPVDVRRGGHGVPGTMPRRELDVSDARVVETSPAHRVEAVRVDHRRRRMVRCRKDALGVARTSHEAAASGTKKMRTRMLAGRGCRRWRDHRSVRTALPTHRRRRNVPSHGATTARETVRRARTRRERNEAAGRRAKARRRGRGAAARRKMVRCDPAAERVGQVRRTRVDARVHPEFIASNAWEVGAGRRAAVPTLRGRRDSQANPQGKAAVARQLHVGRRSAPHGRTSACACGIRRPQRVQSPLPVRGRPPSSGVLPGRCDFRAASRPRTNQKLLRSMSASSASWAMKERLFWTLVPPNTNLVVPAPAT
mmetsp:Transcript_8360/g.52126  ORF Transcript_8360/g.52126 Transcript_8360/m.52126 type:complete len:335 (+) Transcript_8360:5372-6376(+)